MRYNSLTLFKPSSLPSISSTSSSSKYPSFEEAGEEITFSLVVTLFCTLTFLGLSSSLSTMIASANYFDACLALEIFEEKGNCWHFNKDIEKIVEDH